MTFQNSKHKNISQTSKKKKKEKEINSYSVYMILKSHKDTWGGREFSKM